MSWDKPRHKMPVEERAIHVRSKKAKPDHRKLGLRMIKKIRKEQGWS